MVGTQFEKLVIATHNRRKSGEMETILGRSLPGIQILSLADFPEASEPDETGSNYAENAEIKARSAVVATGLPCIADDAGLEVDALNGEPGLYSKRFGGESTSFVEKMKMILGALESADDRNARFRCAVCLAYPKNGQSIHVEHYEATLEGTISDQPFGGGGFGYDPIFYVPELGCTLAQLSPDEKHAISHRGKVLSQVIEWILSNK